ncbi:glutamine synthetase family protein [Maribacter halichondriae]|uniref:glutamine synthetase family protein n=1 Tax=Maribacter halichondriae TaxID=2980554 RepID=UPI002359D578|nr:glutamine synthetase family protein [Maribacter sp. Hal144]
MDKNEIIKKIKENKHSKIKVAIVDIDGVLRGKFMHRDKFLSALESGFGFCSVVFGWDMGDVSYTNDIKVTGWHTGYDDFEARVDLDTFRTIPWEDDMPFFIVDFAKEKAEDLAVCPRSLLRKMIGEAEDMNYTPMFSQEFEWFNYRETSDSLKEKNYRDIQPLTPGMFGYSILRMSENSDYFDDLFNLLGAFNVPLEGLHTETGPGVTEAAIQYSGILEAADRAVLLKQPLKKLHIAMASLQVSWLSRLQSFRGVAGTSIKVFGIPKKKENLFYDGKSKDNMSDLMKSFLAGQLKCLPEILPMFAPTINSFKRLVVGAWAPINQTWGHDNRTCSLRVLASGKKSTRIEHRVVGSDVNPYLAMAACLGSGLYGIKHKLKLDTPETKANGYEVKKGILPSNLWDASQKMKNSKIAKDLFGIEFVDHFTKTREWEWKQFSAEVTDWETKRYFEII